LTALAFRWDASLTASLIPTRVTLLHVAAANTTLQPHALLPVSPTTTTSSLIAPTLMCMLMMRVRGRRFGRAARLTTPLHSVLDGFP